MNSLATILKIGCVETYLRLFVIPAILMRVHTDLYYRHQFKWRASMNAVRQFRTYLDEGFSVGRDDRHQGLFGSIPFPVLRKVFKTRMYRAIGVWSDGSWRRPGQTGDSQWRLSQTGEKGVPQGGPLVLAWKYGSPSS